MTVRITIECAVARYLRLPEEADDCADEVMIALERAGLVIVPREPTEAMQAAGAAVWRDVTGHAPTERASGPYRKQERVTAILDIAYDGTLAGVELVLEPLPPAPGPVKITNHTLAGGASLTIRQMPQPENIEEIRARERTGDKYPWVESASDADVAKFAMAVHNAMGDVFPNSAYEGAMRAQRILARLLRAEARLKEQDSAPAPTAPT